MRATAERLSLTVS